MLPPFDDQVLPPGEHVASWAEIEARFSWSPHRARLLGGFRRGVDALVAAGCPTVWLDGSFVTAKEVPNDFDACWELSGVDLAKLDPVLRSFDHGRLLQKVKYLGEFFPNVRELSSGRVFLEFFQMQRANGQPKGIVRLELGDWGGG